MKFFAFSQYLQRLDKTASRNKMTENLAELFEKADANEVDKICYLSLGRLVPKFTGIEFNLAEKMMGQVLSCTYETEVSKVRKLFKKIGDLGDVAKKLKIKNEKLKTTIKNSKLSVSEVYKQLCDIAQERGEGSVERKIEKMAGLLNLLDSLSAKYVTRIPLGKLRLGFSEMTILDALSWMITKDKSLRGEIERAYNVRADVGEIVKKVKTQSAKLKTTTQNLKLKKLREFLEGIKPQLGVPIVPALCQRLANAEEMIEKMGKVAVEPKYDGTRLQIHFSKKRKWEQLKEQLAFDFKPQGFVRTFTRNLENTTGMFPDLVKAVFEEVEAKEAILDCEAIGFDRWTGKFLPFQETIKRKRKYGVREKAKEIPLKFFCFDLLYKDGEDLLKTPFNQRREILEKILKVDNQTMILSPQIVTDDPNVLRHYHDEQIKKGLEGAVVKKWQAAYDSGRRGFTWVKFKQEEGKKGGGLADTLDCVVMGYYQGKGKRAGFGIGAFLVGILQKPKTKNQKPKTQIENAKMKPLRPWKGGVSLGGSASFLPHSSPPLEGRGILRREIKRLKDWEGYVTISKIGTGLSDEQWKKLKAQSSKLKAQNKPKEYIVDKNLVPDVWTVPGLVVEIEADNITKSPIHTAGYALRFPRLIRFRDDKSPEQATTLMETKRLYQLQNQKRGIKIKRS